MHIHIHIRSQCSWLCPCVTKCSFFSHFVIAIELKPKFACLSLSIKQNSVAGFSRFFLLSLSFVWRDSWTVCVWVFVCVQRYILGDVGILRTRTKQTRSIEMNFDFDCRISVQKILFIALRTHNVAMYMYRATLSILTTNIRARVGVFFIYWQQQNNWNILYRFFISFDLFGCAPAPFRQQFIYNAVCCYCCRLNQIPITCTNCDDITQSECECLGLHLLWFSSVQFTQRARVDEFFMKEIMQCAKRNLLNERRKNDRTTPIDTDTCIECALNVTEIKILSFDCVRLCILLFIGNGRTISLSFISSLRCASFFICAATKRCIEIEIEIKSFGYANNKR